MQHSMQPLLDRPSLYTRHEPLEVHQPVQEGPLDTGFAPQEDPDVLTVLVELRLEELDEPARLKLKIHKERTVEDLASRVGVWLEEEAARLPRFEGFLLLYKSRMLSPESSLEDAGIEHHGARIFVQLEADTSEAAAEPDPQPQPIQLEPPRPSDRFTDAGSQQDSMAVSAE